MRLPEGWEWKRPPRKVPEEEFTKRAREAKRRQSQQRRGIHDGKDPLAGQRKGLADGTLSRLIYPGDKPCPVNPGDMFTVRGGVEVTITSCVRKLKNGKHRWEVAFDRRVEEKPLLLRRVPPIVTLEADDDGKVLPPMADDIERARLQSSYTTSAREAVPDAGVAVDPDWHDQGKEKREEMRLQAVREENEIGAALEAMRKHKARLDRVGVMVVRSGKADEVHRLLDRWADELADLERSATVEPLREAA